ncbi:hypothetical protein GCM10028824_31240 [Hymenobacter segetis]|uniref:FG-GAP-like repeat-containing protein n=1 Tax=Hymenobacter segetis TaxID=2025509 RepID=A0ABU9LS43_9BACT
MPHSYSRALWALPAALLLAPLGAALAQAPVISSVIPMANARAAARNSPVTVTFNQPLTAASAGALKVFSAQRGGLRSRGTTPAVASGSALSFAPSAYPFMPGETVQYTATTAAAGTGGVLAQGRVGQFTTATGGAGRGDFVLPATPPNTNVGSPKSIAIGDVDGDGDLDLITTNYYNAIAVLRNDGSGAFTRSSLVAVGNVVGNVSSLVLGDMDGDGDLDFAAVNREGGTVSVRLNDGSGTFTAPGTGPEIAVGTMAATAALCDVDGDGDLDLLCTTTGNNLVSIRLNNGAAVFAASATTPDIAVGDMPYGLTVGDIDGDGDLDVITANGNNATVSVRFNNGNGTFTAAGSNPNPSVASLPIHVALGDIDGDGDLDLLAMSDYTISIRMNDGLGNFTSPPTNPNQLAVGVGSVTTAIALSDVDSDGDLDLLATRQNAGFPYQYGLLCVRLNNGQGLFTPPATNANSDMGALPSGLAVGDVDGDGDVDAMATNGSSNTVTVRLNGGTALAAAAGRPAAPALALSPNPAPAGHGPTTLTGAVPNAPLTVLDALGRVLLTATADAAGTARLALPAGLPAGVYLVRSGGQVRRLVVE